MNQSEMVNGGLVFGVWFITTMTLALVGIPWWVTIPGPMLLAGFVWFFLEHGMEPNDVVDEMFQGGR